MPDCAEVQCLICTVLASRHESLSGSPWPGAEPAVFKQGGFFVMPGPFVLSTPQLVCLIP